MLTREDSESWASVKAVLVHAQSGHLHNIPLVRNRSNSLGAHTGYTDNRAAMFLLPDQPYLGHARKVM